MNAVSYQELAPDAGLRSLIDCAWRVSVDAPIDDFIVAPDGCVDVLFSIDKGLQFVGAMTAAESMVLPAGAETIGLRLRPGAAAPWLRLDLTELTNGQVPLRELIGSQVDALEDQLRALRNPRHRALALGDQIARALDIHWAEASDRQRALQRALAALARSDGDVSIEWLALQCNLGTRQFQRRCQAATGLPPKLLARVLRLMRVLRTRQRTQANWTILAAECGFADQAHFIHDFEALIGCSPGAYARGRGDVRFSQAEGVAGVVEFCAC